MQEAWLLFDEQAIRRAAGKPNGRHPLNLPNPAQLEAVPNPKETLIAALRSASELRGRRLARFNPHRQAYRLAQLIDDYSPLRQLPAFAALERDIQNRLTSIGLRAPSP